MRNHYNHQLLDLIARLLKSKDPGHTDSDVDCIIEDLKEMSDFEILKCCENYACPEQLKLGNNLISNSGKFKLLDHILLPLKENGDRVLIFSQFTKKSLDKI